jgi:hypothetical protein
VVLVVVLVDGVSNGDMFLGVGWEGKEVNSKVVVCPKELEGVRVGDADFGECIAEDGGGWSKRGEDHTKDVVDVRDVVWSLDSDFLGGDEVHDFVAGGVACKLRREWLGFWHGALPAFAKGDED